VKTGKGRVLFFLPLFLFFILNGTAVTQEYAPDEILVNGASPAQLASLSDVETASVKPVGMGGDLLVKLAAGTSPVRAVSILEKLPNVKYASLNYIRRAYLTPTDPDYGSQWAWPKIDAPQAWDITTGGAAVTVGVIDTGLDLDHPDLAANVWVNPMEAAGLPGEDDDGNGYVDDLHGWNFVNDSADVDDDNGHGSHCSGVIGAVANNGAGGAGANWAVSLMSLKFLNAMGSGSDADAIEAIDYVITTNAAGSSQVRVLATSWGGHGENPALQASIERARDAGLVFVAAAGGSAFNIDSPWCVVAPGGLNVENIVTVVATDESDALAGFSNYGPSLCALGAPGVSIFGPYKEGAYQTLSGTSMAAAHVSGVLALTLAADPSLSMSQLMDRLLLNVDPLPSLVDRVSTGGRLNAWRAVADEPNPGYTADRDGDGIANHLDNCPYASNPGQEDSNNDGVGNACTGPLIPCSGGGCGE